MKNKKNILVFGDSHSRVFKYCNAISNKFNFNVNIISGATAQGAVNPNNKSHSLKIIRNQLKNINRDDYDYVMIMLGEVDCGFVIWYRAEKHNISIDDQLNTSVTNLFKFVNDELYMFNQNNIIILGANLPTIKDNTNKNFLSGARSEVNATILERTQITIKYNALLSHNCKSKKYNYIDIVNETINKRTNIIKDKFLNNDPYDHHLSSEITSKIWLKKLNKILK